MSATPRPCSRIAQLCTSDITMTDRGETAITFARGANVLPEPLASIALALRCQRVADGEQDGWLLSGRKPGTHITAEHLRKRLAVHGITSRPGRHGALLALAGTAMRGGEVADFVTASLRVVPRRALDKGYTFRYPELEPALRDLLGR